MKTILHLALCLAMAMLAGCSSFERDWRVAVASPSPRDPLAGAWDGRWTSAKHRGAGGRLRAIVRPADGTGYVATFRANWLVFESGHTTPLRARPAGGALAFSGSQDLGPLFGGLYRYEGTADGRSFRAIYRSGYDDGDFAMTRMGSAAVSGRR